MLLTFGALAAFLLWKAAPERQQAPPNTQAARPEPAPQVEQKSEEPKPRKTASRKKKRDVATDDAPKAVAQAPAESEVRVEGSDRDIGSRVYQRLLKSAVFILNYRRDSRNRAKVTGMGSGTLIDKTNRIVLTNYHVVGDDEEVGVYFPIFEKGKLVTDKKGLMRDYKPRVGRVLQRSKGSDLALVQLESLPDGVQTVRIASGGPEPGQPVHSVGSPGDSGALWLYTSGSVRQISRKSWKSALGARTFDLEAQVIETQSPINPGDSGGPLVNDKGELIGVTQGHIPSAQLLNYFIHWNEVRTLLDSYARASGTKLDLDSGASGVAAGPDTSQLIRLAGNTKSSQRLQAIQALELQGVGAKTAIPILIQALKDSDPVIAAAAAQALESIGPPPKEGLQILLTGLRDANASVRLYSLSALAKMGPDADFATSAVVGALADPDVQVRQKAALALAKIGKLDKTLVFSSLESTFRDPDKSIRVAVVQAVGEIDLPEPAQIKFLVKAIDDRSADVRLAAIDCLRKLGPRAKEALPVLTNALKDPDREVRSRVGQAMAAVGEDVGKAVPALVEDLKSKAKDTRKKAMEVLASNGSASKEAVPQLIDSLKDKDPELRAQAAATLGSIGPEAKQAARELIFLLKDLPDVRSEAISALAKIGKPAVDPLIAALDYTSAKTRSGAVEALGQIGPDARQALIRLSQVYNQDPDKAVRRAAGDALIRIQAK
jgi:HEAT repeat protein